MFNFRLKYKTKVKIKALRTQNNDLQRSYMTSYVTCGRGT